MILIYYYAHILFIKTLLQENEYEKIARFLSLALVGQLHMDIHASRLHLSGRTDRVNQLAHVSLIDGKSNTSVGLNIDYVRGAENTVVGAYAGVLDAMSRGVVFVGESSGRKAQRAVDSVAIGCRAMENAHTTQNSVFIGTDTGKDARRATYCTAIGHASGSKLGTALRTTLVGSMTGQFAVNIVDDTFVGYGSGGRCRDGARNSCLGAFSAHRLDSGTDNVLIGYSAGANIGTAHRIVGIGPFALENANNSSNVIAIGPGAGRYAANAENSMFVGTESGQTSNGGFNVYVGPFAGNAGSFNTMVGYGTGKQAQGNNNTYIGYYAGINANGNDNTVLGHAAGNIASGSRNTYIGSGAGCEGDSNAILGTKAGSQGLGSNNALIGFQTAQYLIGNNNVIAGVNALIGLNPAPEDPRDVEAHNCVIMGQNILAHDLSLLQSLILSNSVAIGSGIAVRDDEEDIGTTILEDSVILGKVTVSSSDSGAFVVGAGNSRMVYANMNVFQVGEGMSKTLFAADGILQIGNDDNPTLLVSKDAMQIGRKGAITWGEFKGFGGLYQTFDSETNRVSVSFDRSKKQYFVGPTETPFEYGSNGFTALAYIKFTGEAGYYETILSFGNGDTNIDGNMVISRNSNDSSLTFILHDEASGEALRVDSAADTLVQDEWAVFGVRYDPTPDAPVMQILKNNVIIAQQEDIAESFSDQTLSRLLIGRSTWDVDEYLNADLACIVVYDRALNDIEMEQAYAFCLADAGPYPSEPTFLLQASGDINVNSLAGMIYVDDTRLEIGESMLATADILRIGISADPIVYVDANEVRMGQIGTQLMSIRSSELDGSVYIGSRAGEGALGSNNALIGFQTAQYLVGDNNVIAGVNGSRHVEAQSCVIMGQNILAHDQDLQPLILSNSVAIGSGIAVDKEDIGTTILEDSVILGKVTVSSSDSGAFVVGAGNSRMIYANMNVFQVGEGMSKTLFAADGILQIGNDDNPTLLVSQDAMQIGRKGAITWGEFKGFGGLYQTFGDINRVIFERSKKQYFVGPTETSFEYGSQGFTALAYIKFTGEAGYFETIFSFGNGDINADGNIVVSRNFYDSSLMFILQEGVYGDTPFFYETLASESGTLVQDEWAVFAVRFNPNPDAPAMQILKNNVIIAQQEDIAESFSDKVIPRLLLGRSTWDSEEYLNAELSCLMVYDRTLSDSEMEQAYAFCLADAGPYPSEPTFLLRASEEITTNSLAGMIYVDDTRLEIGESMLATADILRIGISADPIVYVDANEVRMGQIGTQLMSIRSSELDGSVYIGSRAGEGALGSNNALIGFETALSLTGSNNVVAGTGSANHVDAENSVIVGPRLFSEEYSSLAPRLLNSVTIGTGIMAGNGCLLSNSVVLGSSINANSALDNSIIFGSSIDAPNGLVGSVVLGSGMSMSSLGADDNKCIIGIAGQRAIEATAYSLRLGGNTNTFMEADLTTFVLGPRNRPHMQVNRLPEGSEWNNSKTCFPASPTSMLRSLGYAGNTLVRCDSVPALRPVGSATPNLINARPYSSEANNRLPSDDDSSWFGAPVFINAMGDLRYINLSFRDELSKSPHVDAIGQTLGGGSFSVEAWVLIDPVGGLDRYGPIFGSMNSDPVTPGGDVTDWALGISCFNVAGVENVGTRYPMFMYSLPDGSGWMKLMANIPSINVSTWYHLAVIGEAGKLYMFVDGARVEMFQIPFSMTFDFSNLVWQEVYGSGGIYSDFHEIPDAGFTAPGIRPGFQGAGLRVGRVYTLPIPHPTPVYYPSCVTAYVTEVMYRSPRFTPSEEGYANNIDGFPKPASARAVPTIRNMGATVYITPVGETPVLGVNDFAELHGVRASGFELWPYTPPSSKGNWWQGWVGEDWFPMPRTMPDTSIRVFGGGCIHMQKMPIYLESTGSHGISTNGSGVFADIPAGTVIWGETGSIVCSNPGKTDMVNIQKVMTWSRTDVSIARSTAIDGNMTISGNLTVAGSIDGTISNVAGNFDIGGNLTLGGTMKTSKTSIVSGFGGGPRITQEMWDSPGPTHLVDMNVLMDSCDNVSGMLYIHASSKADDNKNGMATLGIIKSSGYAPAVTVFTSQRSANLSMFTFSTDVQNINLVVSTDAACAICWTFVSGA